MKILIVKTSSLGDIIHVFPVVEYLKQWNPQVKIDWVVEQPFSELVRAHPLIDQTLCVQTKKWRSHLLSRNTWKEVSEFLKLLRLKSYDLILDLQGNFKSGVITWCSKSCMKVGFGYSTVPEWPNLFATDQRFNPPPGKNIREDYLFIAQAAVQHIPIGSTKGVELSLTQQEKLKLDQVLEKIQHNIGLKILVCPGSNWPNKQLSPESLGRFLQSLSNRLNAHFFFIWGNPTEKKIAEEMIENLPQQGTLVDRLSLPVLQNLMTKVDLVLAMDSLPLHLAGTTSTPTYSIFGPSSSHKYMPIGERHASFQGTCPYGKTFEKRCDILRTCQTGACMKQLDDQGLYDHFFQWWGSK